MITSLATLSVRVPYEAEPTQVKVLTPEDFAKLFTLIFKNGRCHMEDSGDAENGPDYHYGGHGWGRLVAFADRRDFIHGHNCVYTDGVNLSRTLSALLAQPVC